MVGVIKSLGYGNEAMKEPNDHPLVILARALPAHVIGSMVLQIGLTVGALVAGSVLLGLFIDTRITNTKPLFTLLLSLVGAVASVYATYRLAMRAVPRARSAYEDWAETKKSAAADAPGAAHPGPGRARP